MDYNFSQLFLGLLLPFLEHLTLGGFRNSGGVLMWALISPLGALLLLENSAEVVRWWSIYVLFVIAGGALQSVLRPTNNLPPAFIGVLFVINITAISSIAIFFLLYFVNQKNEFLRRLRIEEAKSEALLLNILPKEIAAILKNENRAIAERFDQASILFADMVGSTPLATKLAPEQMVNLLNETFSHFDSLVDQYKLEKIRTIGDSYMVASGAPRRRPDHAQVLALLALDMREYLNSRIQAAGTLPLNFRIGLNSGPVIGGVIGKKKFVYDVWGDTVNVASRMESHGLAGEIHISRSTYELIKDEFECESRGAITIKGRGEMQTWFLKGKK
jgi:guanylate cyclase